MAETPTKDLRTPEIREHFARVQQEQKRLGWSDAKLCEVASELFQKLDPYKRIKVTTIEFLSRLKPRLLKPLIALLEKAQPGS